MRGKERESMTTLKGKKIEGAKSKGTEVRKKINHAYWEGKRGLESCRNQFKEGSPGHAE